MMMAVFLFGCRRRRRRRFDGHNLRENIRWLVEEARIEKTRSSSLFSSEEREMNRSITFISTNFEGQRVMSTKQIQWTDSRSGHIAECPSHRSMLLHGNCSPLVCKTHAEREIYWKDYSAVPTSSSSSTILYALPVEIFGIRRSRFCWIEKFTRESSSIDRRIWCSTITSG